MKKNKDIYLVLTSLFPSKGNFRGPFIFDQVKAIRNLSQYEVVIVKIYGLESNPLDYLYDEFKVISFRIVGFPSNILPDLFSKLNATRLYSLLKSKNIEVNNINFIHSHGIFKAGSLAVSLKENFIPNVKTIIQNHGFDFFGFNNGVLKNNKWHHKYLKIKGIQVLEKCDLSVAVSERMFYNLKRDFDFLPKNRYVLYNGVDLNKFYPLVNENKKTEFVIGCVGNFLNIKSQITLIKAVEIILNNNNKIKVKFVGTGITQVDCKKYISTAGMDEYFEFIDVMKHNELNNFYNSLDLFVLPSFSEALGCVYLESIACGIPFIAVREQGIDEIIINKNDFLIEKNNFMHLSELIVKQIAHKSTTNVIINIDINNLIFKYLSKVKSLRT